MKKILLPIIFLVILILLYFGQKKAEAWCPPFCPDPFVISAVTTEATKTIKDSIQKIASTTATTGNSIQLATQSMNSVNNLNTAMIVKAIQSLQDSNINQAKLNAKLEEEIYQYNTFTSPSAQPKMLENASKLGVGIQVSNQVSKKLATDMRKKQFAYSNTAQKPIEYLQRSVAENHPSLEEMAEIFMPSNTTLNKKSLAIAQETIKTVSNHIPPPLLSDSVKKNPNARGYLAKRKVLETRRVIAQSVLTNHIAYHAPTLPEEVTAWAFNQWKEFNPNAGVEKMPGVEEGKLSQAGLFELLSLLRTGNPNYASQIATLNEVGLMRELVQIQAAKLELTRKNNEFLDRLRVIAAIDYLSQLDGTTDKTVKELYAKTIGAQQ